MHRSLLLCCAGAAGYSRHVCLPLKRARRLPLKRKSLAQALQHLHHHLQRLKQLTSTHDAKKKGESVKLSLEKLRDKDA